MDRIAGLRRYTESIKRELYRPATGLLRHPYLSAGIGETYPDLTDWDAVWAGAAYLIAGDAAPLRNSMINLLEHIQPDGKGQRRIGRDLYSAPCYQIRPFLATGCFVLAREAGEIDWLVQACSGTGLDRLDDYLMYRHTHNTGREGLLTWWHIDEGFGDNAVGNWAWEPNAVEAVDLNAQMVLEHCAFAWLAARAGRLGRAELHSGLATRLAASLDRLCWHEEDGCYYSRYVPPARHERPRHMRVVDAHHLWPLWLGLVPAERARAMIERYVLDHKRLAGPFGLRSLAASEPHYNNARRGINQPMGHGPYFGPARDATSSNWQGPVWSVINYLGTMALGRYGYVDGAAELAEKMITLHADALDRHGGFFENHHAETGEGLTALGIGSWCLLVPHVLDHLASGSDWWTRGLTLPTPDQREVHDGHRV